MRLLICTSFNARKELVYCISLLKTGLLKMRVIALAKWKSD